MKFSSLQPVVRTTQCKAFSPQSIIPVLILILAFGSFGPVFAGIQYTVTDLGTLGEGNVSEAYGVNNSGQVVGYSWINSDGTSSRAFLYSGGAMSDLGVVGTGLNMANAINDNGKVVGYSGGSAFLYSGGTISQFGGSDFNGINNTGQIVGQTQAGNAFLFSNGTMSELQMPGGYGAPSGATAINDAGDIVGNSTYGSYPLSYRAFLYKGGTMTVLGTLGGRNSEAEAINNLDQVVGSTEISTLADHAFIYTPGPGGISTWTDLGTLGAESSYAFDINDSGQVVGNFGNSGYASHAFLYSGGIITDLNSLIDPSAGWTLTSAAGINDNGVIVGSGINPAGQEHAFLATPINVPEPTSLAISIFGATGLCLRRSRDLSLNRAAGIA